MSENILIGYELRPIYKNDLSAQDTNQGRACCITRMSIYGTGCCNIEGKMIHPSVYEYITNNKTIKELIWQEVCNGGEK